MDKFMVLTLDSLSDQQFNEISTINALFMVNKARRTSLVMRVGPALILALAIIVNAQSVKNVKTGPCFKFKVTNGDNVTKIDLEHDEGSTIEASADSCNGRRILNISILTSGVWGGIMGAYSEAAPVKRHPAYELFPGIGYYRLQPVALNWESAQAVCKAEGGDLAVINSDAEKNVAVALLRRGIAVSGADFSGWVWVGLKRDGGEFNTVFGDPVSKVGYTVWEQGYPTKNGDCVLIDRNGVLANEPCAKLAAYICEQPL